MWSGHETAGTVADQKTAVMMTSCTCSTTAVTGMHQLNSTLVSAGSSTPWLGNAGWSEWIPACEGRPEYEARYLQLDGLRV